LKKTYGNQVTESERRSIVEISMNKIIDEVEKYIEGITKVDFDNNIG
jgi:hypothetical protein